MREVTPTDQSTYTCIATQSPNLPANADSRKKTENILRLARGGKHTLNQICELVYSGTLQSDFTNERPATQVAVREAHQFVTAETDAAFRAFRVWVAGVLQDHGIEIDER